jgi:hypothetical protein
MRWSSSQSLIGGCGVVSVSDRATQGPGEDEGGLSRLPPVSSLKWELETSSSQAKVKQAACDLSTRSGVSLSPGAYSQESLSSPW